jgi:hypothetical protein
MRKLPVKDLHCPSAQPDMTGARAFGLIDHTGDAPTTAFLAATVPVTPDLLEMAEPLPPTQVFRFSAPCQQGKCSHWQGACSLVDRIVQLLPAASLTLPPCRIRADCRWYAEQGRPACQRCPQVITEIAKPTELMAQAAAPPKR